jgi:hypothetical protein
MANITDSLKDAIKTVVLDAATGERVAHWCEFDHFTIEFEIPVYTLRLAGALGFGRRYIVAVRGLVNAESGTIDADSGFAALRDQTASTVRSIHDRRERFETETFTPLDSAGVSRDELQLAFDFTTASEEHVTGTVRDLQAAMAATMAEL